MRNFLGAGSLAQESLILEVNVLRRQEGRGPGQSGGGKQEEAGREDEREVLPQDTARESQVRPCFEGARKPAQSQCCKQVALGQAWHCIPLGLPAAPSPATHTLVRPAQVTGRHTHWLPYLVFLNLSLLYWACSCSNAATPAMTCFRVL